MEYLLIKVYSDPTNSIKQLLTYQLKYLYDYFKYEYLTKEHLATQDSLTDRKLIKKIIKNIRKELSIRWDIKERKKKYERESSVIN